MKNQCMRKQKQNTADWTSAVSHLPKVTWRSSVDTDSKSECFFTTFNVESRIQQCAFVLKNGKLIRKLISGDMIVLDTLYRRTHNVEINSSRECQT